MPTSKPYVVPPSQQWEGNDGLWSTFVVRIGVPGQDFRVLPSTAGSETFIPLSGGCLKTDPPTCQNSRGVEDVNGFPSTGFDVSQSTTWKEIGIFTLELDTQLGYNATGLIGADSVSLGTPQQSKAFGEPLALEGQTVAGILSRKWLLGLLGLNTRPARFSTERPLVPSLLQSLRDRRLIPSLSYAYTAGASYRRSP